MNYLISMNLWPELFRKILILIKTIAVCSLVIYR
jgi:hypothetical protein